MADSEQTDTHDGTGRRRGWRLHGDGRTIAPGEKVLPEERLSWPRTISIGAQHVVAMFGATFLVPLLTGIALILVGHVIAHRKAHAAAH